MKEDSSKQGYNFGTFSGVFTPSILTIFGLIMFLRTSEVVGKAGVGNALLILLIATSITLSTGLSLSAISTNTPVEGGGVYFLISRTLGTAFGGSIGVTLFLAQALSIPFYVLGFTESFIKAFEKSIPFLADHVLSVNLAATAFLFFITWIGAKWAIKAQFLILTILLAAITAFMGGAIVNFSPDTLVANFGPTENCNLYALFALFFPAVTGVMAGVNMSGDLKDPQKSIPQGSLIAIFVATIVYGAQMVITGGAFAREELINNPYIVLVSNALFGAGFLVVGGVFAATTSSAIGSFLGAPRVLQALSIDRVYRVLSPFKKGSGEQNEPRRALFLSLLITLGIIAWAGRSLEGGGGVNAVSSVVTMFFLYTYGMVNLAAFVESFGANPSFRPRFKYYHWSAALFGTIACVAVSFMIDWIASVVALSTLALLYFVARARYLEQTFGDAQRGFVYSRIRNNLIQLSNMPMHPKNWRPTIAVMTGNPTARIPLVKYAMGFEGGRGIVSLVEFIVGEFELLSKEIRNNEIDRLNKFVKNNDLSVFPEVLITADFDTGLTHFIQAHSIGPIKPNIIMQGWPKDEERITPFLNHLNTIASLDKNSLVFIDHQKRRFPIHDVKGTIDIWWRGKRNGSLMLLLAHLLRTNNSWKNTTIRLLRTVTNKEGIEPAQKALDEIAVAARIDAETKVILSDSFDETFRNESAGSRLVLLGFQPPKRDMYEKFYHDNSKRLQGMPPAFLVASAGDADFLA